jgi:hypothetical protein
MIYLAADLRIRFGGIDIGPDDFLTTEEQYGPVAPRDLWQIHLENKWGATLRLNPPYVELVKLKDIWGKVVCEEWAQIHIDPPKDL